MDIISLLKLDTDLISRMPVKHRIKSGEEIEINTLTVGQVMKMHPYLCVISQNDLSEMQKMIETFDFSKVPELVKTYLEPINKIIEIAIGRNIYDLATFDDYFILLTLIYSRMGYLSFQKSIILGNQMSPTGRTEIIAGHKFLTSLN